MDLVRSNKSAFSTLDLALKELAGVQGKVGWFSSSKYEDGTPVAYVAALNELGHGNTPPRPFMRPTAIEERARWAATAAGAAKQVLAGKATATDAMGILTLQAEGNVAETISKVLAPPLSPVTIEIRAMKKRNPNLVVTATTVGIAAQKVNQPGYQAPNVSTKPLIDSGVMIATLTHVVEKTS